MLNSKWEIYTDRGGGGAPYTPLFFHIYKGNKCGGEIHHKTIKKLIKKGVITDSSKHPKYTIIKKMVRKHNLFEKQLEELKQNIINQIIYVLREVKWMDFSILFTERFYIDEEVFIKQVNPNISDLKMSTVTTSVEGEEDFAHEFDDIDTNGLVWILRQLEEGKALHIGESTE